MYSVPAIRGLNLRTDELLKGGGGGGGGGGGEGVPASVLRGSST